MEQTELLKPNQTADEDEEEKVTEEPIPAKEVDLGFTAIEFKMPVMDFTTSSLTSF